MFKYLAFLVICIYTSATLAADISDYPSFDKRAYNVSATRFSIDGYDFYADTKNSEFPINEDENFIIQVQSQNQISDLSYTFSVKLTNPKNEKEQIFETRLITNNQDPIVVEAVELFRRLSTEYGDCDGFCRPYTLHNLELKYKIKLDDGKEIFYNLYETRSKPEETSIDFTIQPGDTLHILLENFKNGGDFTTNNFIAQIIREGKIIKYMGAENALEYFHGELYGDARKDLHRHGDTSNIYTITQTKPTLEFNNENTKWEKRSTIGIKKGMTLEFVSKGTYTLKLKQTFTNDNILFRKSD